jgi:DNA-binding transcriptional ArsR family regulator
MELISYGAVADGRLDATFAALADPTRRAILARLAAGEASVAELAAPFAMSQPAISKHLKVLERAGLISRRTDRQRRPCRLEARPLAEATGWLVGYRQFWEQSFQGLDALLEERKAQEAASMPDAAAPMPDAATSTATHPASDPRSEEPCLDR